MIVVSDPAGGLVAFVDHLLDVLGVRQPKQTWREQALVLANEDFEALASFLYAADALRAELSDPDGMMDGSKK